MADLTPEERAGLELLTTNQTYGPLYTLDADRLAGLVRHYDEAVRLLREALSSIPCTTPIDCTTNCMNGPCDCSGVPRLLGPGPAIEAFLAALDREDRK